MGATNKSVSLRIAGTVALAGVLIVNALANILPINGLSTGDVSALYPNLFAPAGFTFSIWSVIYSLLIGFIIFSWIHKNHEKATSIFPWFILSCVLNVVWILAWHHLYTFLSVFIMLMLLVTLTKIFLHSQRKTVAVKGEWIWVDLPFTIYFAWICVATIANISALLTGIGWDAFSLSHEFWTVLMLGVASVIAFRIFMIYRTPAIIAVILWTLVGVYSRWKESEYEYVIYSTIVIGVVLTVATGYFLSRKKVS